MNFIKWFFILAVVIILIGVGGYFLYDTAYAGGEKIGYDEGYASGEQDGYSLGEKDGYDEGYISGKQDGYDEGYEDGSEEGYALGEQDGYDEGYNSGKEDGYSEGYDKGKEDVLEYGYTLRDPTYEEAVEFLNRDKTNENEYIEDSYGVYVCSHFARDVCNNAEIEGLRCAFVEIRYPMAAHSIIGFDTIDEGFVYFDPQGDEKVNPVKGKPYYQCVEPKPGYYYVPPPYDDTIMDILVIW